MIRDGGEASKGVDSFANFAPSFRWTSSIFKIEF